jgi:uncharacterized membrane protein
MAATLSNILLVLTATTTALIAGLFYAWSCSVTIGIGRLSDAAYLEAMQAMNRAILNPVFFLSFLGTVILLPLSTYLHYGQPISVRFWFLLAATLVYIIGGFGITMVGNVPLNETLDAFNLQAASQEAIAVQRAKFEGPWNNLHTVRTVACVLALVLVVMACLSPYPGGVEK